MNSQADNLSAVKSGLVPVFAPGRTAPSDGQATLTLAGAFARRALDVVLAIAGLVFFAPLLLLISILVYCETGGVLFRQRRTGMHGRVFSIYKFRTLYVSEDGQQVDQVRKCDGRVTRMGGLLRSFSLDELPQLFNVVAGDMSIVGPRPHAVSHDRQFAKLDPRYSLRFLVRPGLTGLAQINGARGEIRSVADLTRRVRLDIKYVEQQSLMLDLKIIWQTLTLVWRDERAY